MSVKSLLALYALILLIAYTPLRRATGAPDGRWRGCGELLRAAGVDDLKGYVYLRGLRAARIDAGYTREELGALIHVSKSSIGRWEIRERRAPKDTIPTLCEVLGVTEEALLNHREPLEAPVETRGRPRGSFKAQPTSDEGLMTDHPPRRMRVYVQGTRPRVWDSRRPR